MKRRKRARPVKRERVYRRRRSRFRTARAAWADIARQSGVRTSRIIGTGHTAAFYAWRVKL